MKVKNEVMVRHQDGDCLFQIDFISLEIDEDGLSLEIETRDNQDCVLGFLPPPSLCIEFAPLSVSTVEELQREVLKAHIGWDPEGNSEENVFRIYMGQHQGLDNNEVVLSRDNGGNISIHWTSQTNDFKYYDHRAQINSVEVWATYQVK